MKHGSEGHVDIRGMEPALFRHATQRDQPREGVEHDLSMTEVHSLGKTRGTRGVENRDPAIFIEIRKLL